MRALLHSRRGHEFAVFTIFLAIATVLWMVMAFNDQTQADVRMPVRITHLPDSITIVSPVPRSISVSLQGRGTQLLKAGWGGTPVFNIDFRVYSTPEHALVLTDTDIKGIARSAFDGANVVVVEPDSMRLKYTSQPPRRLPVNADYIVTSGPQAYITGRLRLSSDSVNLYSANRGPAIVEAITTEPIRLNGINETTTRRVRLIAPAGTRVIPDSIDVTVEVEPLIFKTRKVSVEPLNVPHDMRLITFPAQVEVMYMLPVSAYKTLDPVVRVGADYRSIEPGAHTVRLRVLEASDYLQNVHMACDSAEYILERI